jgi:hypothetical protein
MVEQKKDDRDFFSFSKTEVAVVAPSSYLVVVVVAATRLLSQASFYVDHNNNPLVPHHGRPHASSHLSH